MSKGITRVLRNDYVYQFVRSFRERIVTGIGVKRLKYGLPTTKRGGRRFEYYTTMKVGRPALHVLNKYEREKICKEFAALRKYAMKQNPEVVFFPLERVIRLLHKQGFNIIRHTTDMRRIKVLVETNESFALTFRRKNVFIRVVDDFIWKPKVNRRPFYIWKITTTDEMFRNAEACVEHEFKNHREADFFPKLLELKQKCSVEPKLLTRIGHRSVYIDPKNRNYFLKQITHVIT